MNASTSWLEPLPGRGRAGMDEHQHQREDGLGEGRSIPVEEVLVGVRAGGLVAHEDLRRTARHERRDPAQDPTRRAHPPPGREVGLEVPARPGHDVEHRPVRLDAVKAPRCKRLKGAGELTLRIDDERARKALSRRARHRGHHREDARGRLAAAGSPSTSVWRVKAMRGTDPSGRVQHRPLRYREPLVAAPAFAATGSDLIQSNQPQGDRETRREPALGLEQPPIEAHERLPVAPAHRPVHVPAAARASFRTFAGASPPPEPLRVRAPARD